MHGSTNKGDIAPTTKTDRNVDHSTLSDDENKSTCWNKPVLFVAGTVVGAVVVTAIILGVTLTTGGSTSPPKQVVRLATMHPFT